MKLIIAWILIGFFFGALLGLPARFWIVAGLALGGLIFVAGFWACFLVIRGAVRALRDE
jgi:hypothetical protein